MPSRGFIGDNDYSRIAAEIANNGGQFFENQALFPATLGEIPVGHDVNLYAVWVLEEYTVTFLTSGDIVGGNIIGWLGKPIPEGDPRLTQTVEYMGHPSTMHKPGDLTHLSNCIHLQANPGYVFAGWNYEVTLPDGTKLTGTFPEEGEIGSITVYGNTMVRAIWEKTYKLTYQPGEHGDWAEDTIFVEGLRGGRDMLVAYYPDLNGPIDNDPSIPGPGLRQRHREQAHPAAVQGRRLHVRRLGLQRRSLLPDRRGGHEGPHEPRRPRAHRQLGAPSPCSSASTSTAAFPWTTPRRSTTATARRTSRSPCRSSAP